MVAVLGGLGAAVAWALSTLCSSRSSRLTEPVTVVAWVMLVGLVITAPVAAIDGVPESLNANSGAWLALSGVGNVGGLMLTYRAMRIGKVGVVAPVVSTEGAITAVIALLAGEAVQPAVGGTLAVIVIGISLAAVPPTDGRANDGERLPPVRPDDGRPEASRHLEAVLLAIAAAVAFGASLYGTGRAGSLLPAAWVVLSARVVGTIALAIPLAIGGRLRLTRQVLPLVIASGICEVLGFFSFTLGARHGIAVAAVLSSQFAALAALVAYHLFGERLSRIQVIGVCTVVAGVAVLSALRA